jgi:rod shape-determining protein MreC
VFVYDKGTLSGIEKKAAVITKEGLVGFVTEAGTTWAKISTILEPETSIGGIVVSTSDVGIVEGSLQLMKDGKCKMSYLSRNAKIALGDRIETSGFGMTYPKGIVVGEITDLVVESHGVSQYAVIKPLVDFNSLKEVMVVKSFKEVDGIYGQKKVFF